MATGVHSAALAAGNGEIEGYSANNLWWLLQESALDAEEPRVVRQLSTNLTSLSDEALSRKAESRYLLVAVWYREVVIPTDTKERCHIEYVRAFNDLLFEVNKMVIERDDMEVWKREVALLTDSLHSIKCETYTLMRATEDNLKNRRDIDKVKSHFRRLDSLLRAKTTREILDEIVSLGQVILYETLGSCDSDKDRSISEAWSRFMAMANRRHRNQELKDVFFMIGAYCLFKRKVEFVRELWDYAQPRDADASWAGDRLVSGRLDDLVEQYFELQDDRHRMLFEGRHGSSSYLRDYFLAACARACEVDSRQAFEFSFIVEPMEIRRKQIHRIDAFVRELEELLGRVEQLKEDEKLAALYSDAGEAFATLHSKLKDAGKAAGNRVTEACKSSPLDERACEQIRSQLSERYITDRLVPNLLAVKAYDADRDGDLEFKTIEHTLCVPRDMLTPLWSGSSTWVREDSKIAAMESQYLLEQLSSVKGATRLEVPRMDGGALSQAVRLLEKEGRTPDRIIWTHGAMKMTEQVGTEALVWREREEYFLCNGKEIRIILARRYVLREHVVVLDSQSLGHWVEMKPFATAEPADGWPNVEFLSSIEVGLHVSDPKALVLVKELEE